MSEGPAAAPLPRRAARAAMLAVLALLAVAFGASEIAASRERAEASGRDAVDVAVAGVRTELAGRLRELERQCADLAETALARTEGVSDRAALFASLAALPFPPEAGVQVEDRDGNLLAWTGAPADARALAAIPQSGDGAVLVESASSRRVAARRTRTVTRPDLAARAVCHIPVEIRTPLRNRFFRSWRIEDDLADRRRVGDCEVLMPGDERGEPVTSAFGGVLARIDVTPLPADAWNEVVSADLAVRRARFLAAAALLLGALAAVRLLRTVSSRPGLAWTSLAGLAVGVRLVLALVSAADVLPASPVTDPRRYAHGLPLALAASPADLLLTGLAVLGAAAALRRAAIASRRDSSSPWPGALAALAAAALSGALLSAVVEDAVRNSTVEFFTDFSVLPLPASAALAGSLAVIAIASALLVASAWIRFAPREPPARLPLAALCAVAAYLAVPFGPGGTASDGGLAVAGVLGMASALAVLVFDTGTAARAAVVPLGAALAFFAPLEAQVAAAMRRSAESAARVHMAESDQTARFLVLATLDRIESSPEVAEAIARGEMSQEFQVRLWASTPLASHAQGSSIEIEPRDTRLPRARFTVNLPPTPWLPGANAWPPLGEVSAVPEPGRGPGRDGRWLLGSRRIDVNGVFVATVRVAIEVRRPSNPGLPELEILGAAAEPDARRTPQLAVSRYDADGRRVETNDTARAVPDALSPEQREAAGEGPVWLARAGADAGAALLMAKPGDGAARSYYVFTWDTGGLRRLALRGARALLCGAVLGALALAVSVRRWGRGARRHLAHRLVLSYVVVSGAPLLVLGWANRELARERADEAAARELSEAVSLLVNVIEEPGADLPLRLLELDEAAREERLRSYAYGAGHHVNVFYGADLLASSDEGLFGTELLPRLLPGPVFREIAGLERPFARDRVVVGGETFEVGYAPIRSGPDQVVGAVSVPLLQQRRTRDADLSDGITAILALYLLSLVAAVGVGTWLAARLTRPLRDLTTATQRVAAGDLTQPVPLPGPGELGEVVGAFNRMMQDLAESRARLVRAEKEAAWRDMARQVAHEVKNPLTPMRLAAEHLRRAFRDGAPNLSDVVERSVDLIVRQTESLKRIATAFSDFARLPGRRRDPTDVADLARRTADLYASTPRVTVRTELASDLPAVLADPDELQRVLVNLVKNAVEALGERGGTVSVRARRDAEAIAVDVQDDGPGIPADVLPRLFEPYFSTKTSGTGLGLAICKRAVEDLGGTISVRSAPNAGTTVTLRIPLVTRTP